MVDRHVSLPFARARMPATARATAVPRPRCPRPAEAVPRSAAGVRDRRVRRRHARHRRVEVVEDVPPGSTRRSPRRRSRTRGSSVATTSTAGLAHRLLDQLDVEREDRPQVDHLGVDALRGERLRRLQRLAARRSRVAHDRDVAARPRDRRLPDRDERRPARRPRRAAPVRRLCMKKIDRVVAPQRRLEDALRVRGLRRHHHDQARACARTRPRGCCCAARRRARFRTMHG